MGKLVMKLAGLSTGLENEDVMLPEDLANVDPDTIEGALESDDLMAAEIDAVEDVSAIQQDLDTVDRLEAQATGLEDLATVLDHVNENNEGGVTESEAVLTEIASDMAVVGTDLKTDEDVVPGLESLIGHRVSTESLKETAKKYWKKIIEFIKAIWARIKAFFGNAEARITTYKRQALKLMKHSDKLTGDNDKTFRMNLTKFAIDGDIPEGKGWGPKALTNYTKSGKALDEVVAEVVEPLVSLSKDVNEKAKQKITSSDDAVALLKKVNDDVAKMLTSVKSKVGDGLKFMGNKNLTHNLNDALKDAAEPTERATTLRSASLTIETSEKNFKNSFYDAVVAPLTIAEIRVVGKEVIRQLSQLEKMYNGPVKQLLDLKFDKLELNIEKDVEQGAAAVKAIMQYSTLIARLSGKVIPAMMNVSLTNVATMLSMANKSASGYATK